MTAPTRITPRSVLAAVAVWLALSAPALGEKAFAPQFVDRAAFGRFVKQGWDSPFGLDYVFIHSPGARNQALVDDVCGKVPIRWANFARVEWGTVERRPPNKGKHNCDWSELDGAVRAWQRNGVHIMMSLRFYSPWATAPRDGSQFVYLKGVAKWLAEGTADYLPKPEYAEDLRRYVRALVERYDGDGVDDMPGLLFPVLHYQVGNEYSNELFWAGTVEEYGRLLREFARAARAASSDVKIILSGIGFEDVYGFYDVGMDPRTEAYVQRNLPRVPKGMRAFVRRTDEFSRTSAGFGDAYDILDARWPNYGIVAKSKELLRQVGCPDKEVWSAEIYSGFPLMEPLVLPNWTLHAWPTPSRSQEYIRILKKPGDPKFDEINAWYRGLQAAQVVKLSMVALDAGSRKLMMGWAVDAQHPLAVSTLSHHGLYSITFKKLWPAGYTYGLVIRKLNGLTRVRRLPMPENSYVYECSVAEGKRVLVAFCNDHVGQNHDEPTGQVDAAIPLSGRGARITHVITRIDQAEPQVEQARVEGGVLRIRLGEYPVFIEATDAAGGGK